MVRTAVNSCSNAEEKEEEEEELQLPHKFLPCWEGDFARRVE
jgi:hypothetical protein